MGQGKEGRSYLLFWSPRGVAGCVAAFKAQGDDTEGNSGILTPSPFVIEEQLF